MQMMYSHDGERFFTIGEDAHLRVHDVLQLYLPIRVLPLTSLPTSKAAMALSHDSELLCASTQAPGLQNASLLLFTGVCDATIDAPCTAVPSRQACTSWLGVDDCCMLQCAKPCTCPSMQPHIDHGQSQRSYVQVPACSQSSRWTQSHLVSCSLPSRRATAASGLQRVMASWSSTAQSQASYLR